LELTDGSAVNILVESINANPLHWGAWLELSVLVTDKDMVFDHYCSLKFSVVIIAIVCYYPNAVLYKKRPSASEKSNKSPEVGEIFPRPQAFEGEYFSN